MPFTTLPGHPQPLGSTRSAGGVNFSLYSEHATKVDLSLFTQPDDPLPAQVIEVTSRTLFYWHVFVEGLPVNSAYAYRVDGPSSDDDIRRYGHRFNSRKVLIDPYRPQLDAYTSHLSVHKFSFLEFSPISPPGNPSG